MSIRAQGMRTWLLQRLSALYMAIFILVLLGWLCATPLPEYSAWRALMGHPAVSIATAIFFFLLLIHAWVGIRDVLVDYVSYMPLRFIILVLLALFLQVMGIWVMIILLSVVRI